MTLRRRIVEKAIEVLNLHVAGYPSADQGARLAAMIVDGQLRDGRRIFELRRADVLARLRGDRKRFYGSLGMGRDEWRRWVAQQDARRARVEAMEYRR